MEDFLSRISKLQEYLIFRNNDSRIRVEDVHVGMWDKDYACVRTNLKYLSGITPWEIHEQIQDFVGKDYIISYLHGKDVIEFFKRENHTTIIEQPTSLIRV